MKRADKIAAVEKMNKTFSTAPHAILTSFRGLTVNQASQLRSRIRQAGGEISVIKNRLAKRAADGTPMQPLVAQLDGPCALATHDADPVVLAKTLADFSKDVFVEDPSSGLTDDASDAPEDSAEHSPPSDT